MNEERTREIELVETLLVRAAASFAYPATPPLAAAVRARVEGLAARRPPWRSATVLRFAAAGAAALLVALGAALAVPQSRDALADFFGLSHVRVEVGPVEGPTPPALSPESFARPVTAGEAQDAVDFPLLFPMGSGRRIEPDAVYLHSAEGNTAIFVYEDEGYDLYQTRSSFYGKGGPDPSLIHDIEFAGRPALWIDEGGHIASFLDEQGRVVIESRRTVDRATLLWEENGVTYRLETSLSQPEAIRVAESLR